jgi:hypothetical protein
MHRELGAEVGDGVEQQQTTHAGIYPVRGWMDDEGGGPG